MPSLSIRTNSCKGNRIRKEPAKLAIYLLWSIPNRSRPLVTGEEKEWVKAWKYGSLLGFGFGLERGWLVRMRYVVWYPIFFFIKRDFGRRWVCYMGWGNSIRSSQRLSGNRMIAMLGVIKNWETLSVLSTTNQPLWKCSGLGLLGLEVSKESEYSQIQKETFD